jgi:hypothetical protein
MKIAVFVDGMHVTRWQAAALRLGAGDGELIVYNCLNTRAAPRRAVHGLYYLLNLFTIRNPLTRMMPLSEAGVRTAPPVDFESEYEGAWQRLPEPLLDRIAADAPDVILKFGLSLLRVPDETRLAAPILSYHHGDPRRFRGRPAGFYETLQGERLMGQIVQILSNKLDAGRVVAFGETKVHPHSYRRTLVEAYRHSPLLVKRAIANATAGLSLEIPPTGKAYKLPGNATVARFVLGRLRRLAGRLVYGAFFEKAWSVSTAPAQAAEPLGDASLAGIADPSRWTTMRNPEGYTFLADPFFHPGGDGLLAEAMNGRSGRGEILHLKPGGHERLSDPHYHLSYPASLCWEGQHYVVPEIAEWSAARIFRLEGGALREEGFLDLPGEIRVVDPTLLVEHGRTWLFGNDLADGGDVLRLWTAPDPFGRFEEHPASPLLVSPEGGRMAGEIVRQSDALYRLGQDGSGDYGRGLIVFRIETLSADAYRETRIRTLSFDAVMGPHTLNFRGGEAAFDWYRQRFSLGAGLRRVRGRLARR